MTGAAVAVMVEAVTIMVMVVAAATPEMKMFHVDEDAMRESEV